MEVIDTLQGLPEENHFSSALQHAALCCIGILAQAENFVSACRAVENAIPLGLDGGRRARILELFSVGPDMMADNFGEIKEFFEVFCVLAIASGGIDAARIATFSEAHNLDIRGIVQELERKHRM